MAQTAASFRCFIPARALVRHRCEVDSAQLWPAVNEATETDSICLSPPSSVQKFISEDRLPHLLLYGPPGTGKTSTILAYAKQLYKDKEFGSMVLEVNERITLNFPAGLWFLIFSSTSLFSNLVALLVVGKKQSLSSIHFSYSGLWEWV